MATRESNVIMFLRPIDPERKEDIENLRGSACTAPSDGACAVCRHAACGMSRERACARPPVGACTDRNNIDTAQVTTSRTIANTPTTTMIARSAGGGNRRP